MKQYLDLVKEVLENGNQKGDRTGTGTKSIFGHQLRFDLSKGFPMVTTKKLHLKSIIYELLWFINEQIKELSTTLKDNPNSRRMLVSAWNPSVLPDTTKSFEENVANGKAALPPCHAFFQFYVNNGKLSCQLYQRSADVFLGVPFNIASYALFTMMIAQVCGYEAGDFVHTFGDAHIYNNHIEQVNLQLSRDTKSLPKMEINPDVKSIFDFKFEDFKLVDYNPHPHIKGSVAI